MFNAEYFFHRVFTLINARVDGTTRALSSINFPYYYGAISAFGLTTPLDQNRRLIVPKSTTTQTTRFSEFSSPPVSVINSLLFSRGVSLTWLD